jgi:hypothetical protein
VRYPILPKITKAGSRAARREILHIRDSSLYKPRDFDISPYFEVVKPTIVHGFDYTALHWADKQKPLEEVAGTFSVFPEAISAPPLVPEAIDQEAPDEAPPAQMSDDAPMQRAERASADHVPLLKRLAMYGSRRRGRARERAA